MKLVDKSVVLVGRVGKLADESGLRELEVGPSVVIGDVPPWLLPDPVVDLTLVEKRKDWSEVSDIVKLIDKYIGRRFYAFFCTFHRWIQGPR